MSFQDLEAGTLLPPRPPPPPPRAVVAHCVFQINTKVSALRYLADELAAGGCGGDTRATRERIHRARADATRLARNTARRLANPAAAADVGPDMAADFQAALRGLQWVQERIIEADRQETAAAARRARSRPPCAAANVPSPVAAVAQESNSSIKCLLLTALGLVMLIFTLVFVA
ncbi:unnamed protein product [Urochloa humidicola]